MSSDKRFLVLRLCGPFQSWGFDSHFNRRGTGLMPTKSGVAGICCAALGYDRGCEEEHQFLRVFAKVKMTSINLPRSIKGTTELPIRRCMDFHTVQNTLKAKGNLDPNCVLTHRSYLNDAAFGIILEGKKGLLKLIEQALANPKRGVWLGRKACVPSTPVLVGLRENRRDALSLLIGENVLASYTHQEEVDDFAGGQDYVLDNALSFASGDRTFVPRRIRTINATLK
ncbi:type I-E CRISPR-associated protein Cas5/CasD [Desulforhopalus singaporensis]|uniref:CRISPR-associated protein, Cas5e family n=1 Tax=Desulforhopalus singaporensis TaxID=91360 RepID=A0A1H0TUU8_9BACT|nr:type I-E CRISPR-associated protein Cas5/CasD [Desulforhopalus singaporensis]SDP57817.1 CRISPR-associated protein, Cas5e family [Desulforhopalus singaporensis]